VGAVQPLDDLDDSPFLGDLRPGASCLAVEAGLFRAPAAAYAPRASDFLLLRSPAGAMRLRTLTGTVAAGQQLPLVRIPQQSASSRTIK
jgi:transcription initiation factor TFIID subunit 1